MEEIIKYVIVILFVLLSYTIIERMLFHFSVLKNNDQLWSGVWYYLYGICLLVSVLIIRPIDFVFKVPSGKIGFAFFIIGVMMLFLLLNLKEGKRMYYPKSDDLLECFHFSVIQPLFEEIAFRGIILPILIFFFKGYFRTELILLMSGLLFTLFHRNYWLFVKANIKIYFNFFFLGYILAYIAYTTQSIWISVLYHVLLNGTITVYKNKKVKA